MFGSRNLHRASLPPRHSTPTNKRFSISKFYVLKFAYVGQQETHTLATFESEDDLRADGHKDLQLMVEFWSITRTSSSMSPESGLDPETLEHLNSAKNFLKHHHNIGTTTFISKMLFYTEHLIHIHNPVHSGSQWLGCFYGQVVGEISERLTNHVYEASPYVPFNPALHSHGQQYVPAYPVPFHSPSHAHSRPPMGSPTASDSSPFPLQHTEKDAPASSPAWTPVSRSSSVVVGQVIPVPLSLPVSSSTCSSESSAPTSKITSTSTTTGVSDATATSTSAVTVTSPSSTSTTGTPTTAAAAAATVAAASVAITAAVESSTTTSTSSSNPSKKASDTTHTTENGSIKSSFTPIVPDVKFLNVSTSSALVTHKTHHALSPVLSTSIMNGDHHGNVSPNSKPSLSVSTGNGDMSPISFQTLSTPLSPTTSTPTAGGSPSMTPTSNLVSATTLSTSTSAVAVPISTPATASIPTPVRLPASAASVVAGKIVKGEAKEIKTTPPLVTATKMCLGGCGTPIKGTEDFCNSRCTGPNMKNYTTKICWFTKENCKKAGCTFGHDRTKVRCTWCLAAGHSKTECSDINIQCFNCEEYGHFQFPIQDAAEKRELCDYWSDSSIYRTVKSTVNPTRNYWVKHGKTT